MALSPLTFHFDSQTLESAVNSAALMGGDWHHQHYLEHDLHACLSKTSHHPAQAMQSVSDTCKTLQSWQSDAKGKRVSSIGTARSAKGRTVGSKGVV